MKNLAFLFCKVFFLSIIRAVPPVSYHGTYRNFSGFLMILAG